MPVNDNHVLIVNENHQVFACGFNSTGQVGIGTETQSVSRLTQIEIPVRILHVSAGLQHSLAVAEDGSLWAFGDNNFGQLGLGIYLRSANTPTKIPETQNFCAISTGGYFSLALDRNGKVWSFGINQYGQLGLGDTVHRHTPELNPHLENITVISAGLLHALALDIHGNIWSFGANANGELGLGDNRLSRHIPAKIPNLHDIQSLSSGYLHNLVLDRNGYVWCFGYNQHGQLGLGHQNDQDLPTKIESLSQIVNIWCAGHTSYVKDFSGKVLVFGSNSFGQMGLSRFRDIVCSPLEHPVLSEAHTILPFGESLFCVNHNGTVSSCGRNRYGQLGLGHTEACQTLSVVEQFVIYQPVSRVKSAASV